jgi:hypothetical protein
MKTLEMFLKEFVGKLKSDEEPKDPRYVDLGFQDNKLGSYKPL